jgi:hypothetical protein
MDSGLGSIGQKWLKWIRRMAIGCFRRCVTHPTENILGLVLIAYILRFHFRPNEVGQLLFESDWLNIVAGYFFFMIPALALLNSFLFRQQWKKIVSLVLSSILTSYMMLVLFAIAAFGSDTSLIRRTTPPDGQMLALYQRAEFGGPGDTKHCRYIMQQRRVFPGILRNETIGGESCNQPFPPDLQ